MKKLTPGRKRLINNSITYAIVIAAFVILQVLNAGGMLSSSLQGQLIPICAYIVMALSLNLVVGISGELSLGHAGFMSVGAFSGVVTAMSSRPFPTERSVWRWPWWSARCWPVSPVSSWACPCSVCGATTWPS